MPLPLILAGIGLGLNALSSVAGNILDYKNASNANRTAVDNVQRQLDFNDRAATIAYERQKQLRDEANLYNDPTSQMSRLRNAGLNPYLVYDNGGSVIQSSSVSAPQASSASIPSLPNYFSGLGSSISNSFNTALANAIELVKLRNETKLADANVNRIESQTTGQDLTNNFDAASMSSRLAITETESFLKSALVDKTKADTILSEMNSNLSKAKTTTETYNARLTSYKMAAQAVLNRYIGREKASELALTVAQTKLALANGDLARVQSGLAGFNAQTQRLNAKAALTSSEKMNWDQALVQLVRFILGDHDSIGSKVFNGIKSGF